MLHAMTPPVALPVYNHHEKSPAAVTVTNFRTMSLDELQENVKEKFESHLTTDTLLSLSKQLQVELRHHLKSSPQCMLPSFNYTLPTGQEEGTYLAVEVGGSNLRMALVELQGRQCSGKALEIRRIVTLPITTAVKLLPGHAFFDWMAKEIGNMMVLEGEIRQADEPLRMGVAWSFPIDQTSIRSGNVLGMGKGFLCSDIVKGHDLGDIVSQACRRQNVNVQLDAIVNDTSSALLARAYVDPATRIAFVHGTGTNAAVHLPIAALDPSKFDLRKVKPRRRHTHVLTNTELSMFGKDILPTAKWDDILNRTHMMPDYQPLEYLISGGYIGEILRLIMVEAADAAGLYDGELPESLRAPYSLDTRTLAHIQTDGLTTMQEILQKSYPSQGQLSVAEASFLRNVTHSISRRSMAYFATAVHALSSLLQDLDAEAGFESQLDHISIGCDGSVINKYPQYMERSQQILDEMRATDRAGRKRILLEKTTDGAVLGAGVAGALAGWSPPPSPQ